jgi:hypothetical protein
MDGLGRKWRLPCQPSGHRYKVYNVQASPGGGPWPWVRGGVALEPLGSGPRTRVGRHVTVTCAILCFRLLPRLILWRWLASVDSIRGSFTRLWTGGCASSTHLYHLAVLVLLKMFFYHRKNMFFYKFVLVVENQIKLQSKSCMHGFPTICPKMIVVSHL